MEEGVGVVNEEIWALGAESVILRVRRWGRTLIEKRRRAKPYLLPEIDSLLRRQRTNRECRMLNRVRRLGVRAPTVYAVDWSSYSILMDFVQGEQLKVIAQTCSDDDLMDLCKEFGRMLGLLHTGGVVHGDPTTSNIIVDPQRRLWLVDFGLAEWNATVEMMAVDLHLVRRTLETTHWDRQEIMLDAVLQGYWDQMASSADEILSRMEEIRERGRYH